MSREIEWENEDDFEKIVKYSNYIDRALDNYNNSTLKNIKRELEKTCEYYKYLEKRGFIAVLPFFTKKPRKIRSGVNVILPTYAFPDFLTGSLVVKLSNCFAVPGREIDTNTENEKTLEDIFKILLVNFEDDSRFQKLRLFENGISSSMDNLRVNGYNYSSFVFIFGKN